MKIDVLDSGFIEVIDHLGDDLTVVNSARVSFGKRKTTYEEGDKKLVTFLAKNKHYSPFRHMIIQFHIKAPEFVMRQWYKHVVGIETTNSSATKDHAWNELSGRYVPVKDFYKPLIWRQQSIDNKQGSGEDMPENINQECQRIFDNFMTNVDESYENLLKLGVAKEQARTILPLNQYTEVYWTASFQAIMNFLELRTEKTAQWEIQQYAKALKQLVSKIYPETTNIWFETHDLKE